MILLTPLATRHLIMSQLICANCNHINQDTNQRCYNCKTAFMAPVTDPLQTGDMLAGRYRIVSKAGEGGMSVVYQAVDATYQKFAIKELRNTLLEKYPELVQQFAWEAELLNRLEHHRLPKGVGYYNEAGRYYIVLEFIEGNTLRDLIDRTGNGMAPGKVAGIAYQLCDVLDYLHSQTTPVIVRDIKPANIILQEDNEIKLIDLGIARIFKEAQTEDTQAWGTRAFAAPEAYKRKQSNQQSDIYSLGMTLYYLLTAEYPPDTMKDKVSFDPLPKLSAFNTPTLNGIILKATKFTPEERWHSAVEIQNLLLDSAETNKDEIFLTATRGKNKLDKQGMPPHQKLANTIANLQLDARSLILMWVVIAGYTLLSPWIGAISALGGHLFHFCFIGLTSAISTEMVLNLWADNRGKQIRIIIAIVFGIVLSIGGEFYLTGRVFFSLVGAILAAFIAYGTLEGLWATKRISEYAN